MSAKKILSYGRFVLVILLMLYLILVWMYFKDNAHQLTSSGLLLWFVTIPLLLLGAIAAMLWWQKKADKQALDPEDSNDKISGEENRTAVPHTYELFIYTRVCLPEGNSWSDVIDNDEDLTVLSDDLVDIDGLPILTKPIKNLPDIDSLPYRYMSDEYARYTDFEDGFTNEPIDNEAFAEEHRYSERATALNDTTLRLYALIQEQLVLSDDLLSSLAEHFQKHHVQNENPSNSAIHVHPEWQQHYLVSANEANNTDIVPAFSDASLAKLPIYLCLPASADTAFLSMVIKEQLMDYGIPEIMLSITPIVIDDIDSANNIDSSNPTQFINEHLMPLSQATVPELCFMLIADSQINEEWLDDHLSSNHNANAIPTEAGSLLVFSNKAAQEVLDLDTNTRVLLTEICTSDDKNTLSYDANLLNDKRRYHNHLTVIKNLLIDNYLSLLPVNMTEQKLKADPLKIKSKTNVPLSDISITAMSDINPSIQPYDISVYMSFIEAFTANGALVNEHHLGHYMPSNHWLTPFIGLSLFVDSIESSKQELEQSFFIAQHKHCTMLWLIDSSQTSDS